MMIGAIIALRLQRKCGIIAKMQTHQKEENVMKFKKTTAVLLGAAALAVIPSVPVLRSAMPVTAITAEAAPMPASLYQYSTGGITYELDTQNKEAYVLSYTGSPTKITIGATVSYANGQNKIVGIRENAFKNCSTLATVDLSGAVNLRSIGRSAFEGSAVRYVDINGKNLTIGESAFRNTKKLMYVYVYSGVTNLTVGNYAFTDSTLNDFYCYAKNLTLKSWSFYYGGNNMNFYINSAVDTATIQSSAFSGSWITNLYVYCRNITIQKNAFLDPNDGRRYASIKNVTFGNSAKIITLYDYSFSGLPSLENVSFQNRTADLFMARGTFAYSGLQTITLPDTATSIPELCFTSCQNLTKNPITPYITSIGKAAFQYARLPETISISKNTASIAVDAFTYTYGIKKFSVASANPNYKSRGGVLYSKDESTLLCYPALKTNTSYTVPSSVIPDGAFFNNQYLTKLSIANLSRPYSETVDFSGLTSLTKLTIPDTDYKQTGAYILNRYSHLFYASNLHVLNGVDIVGTKSDGEPYFKSKFKSYILKNLCDNFEYNGFMKYYLQKMDHYVVDQVTDDSMTDMQKAVRLQDWIMNRVEYDPKEAEWCAQEDAGKTPDPALKSEANHCDSSVYLNYVYNSDDKKYHYYTVCDGYARCYRRLLQTAGIEAYYVSGSNVDNPARSGHAWNLVKINGNYYHADVCWDDGNTGKDRFQHFMRSEGVFGGTHRKYFDWCVISFEDDVDYGPTNDLHDGNGVARYDIRDLGCLGKTPGVDQTSVERIEEIASGKRAVTPYDLFAGDIDFDGAITYNDSAVLQQYLNYYKGQGYSLIDWVLENFSK